jgi:arylsulfatase A-like enzyme
MRWPGKIQPGTTGDLPVIGSDFFPTALEAAGLEPPPGVKLDGVAISTLEGERPRPMYWRWGGFVAYREGPWKIVTDEAFERPELYNLDEDLAETADRAAREPERLAAMLERLRAYTAEVEAEGPGWWRTHGWNRSPKRTRKPAAIPAG